MINILKATKAEILTEMNRLACNIGENIIEYITLKSSFSDFLKSLKIDIAKSVDYPKFEIYSGLDFYNEFEEELNVLFATCEVGDAEFYQDEVMYSMFADYLLSDFCDDKEMQELYETMREYANDTEDNI